jgi:hypothetical protein
VHEQLVQLIATAKNHEFELKSMRATAKQAAADRKAMIRAGDGIRSRLASALAFEHGATSAVMAEFGIRPRKPGGRKKKASPVAQTLTHSTAPAAGGGGEGTAK